MRKRDDPLPIQSVQGTVLEHNKVTFTLSNVWTTP